MGIRHVKVWLIALITAIAAPGLRRASAGW